MPVMKTPGVYIVEKNAFPNSIVEVATAVPAFVGYTEKAENRGKPLAGKPWRISSMAEYRQAFGQAPRAVFDLKEAAADGSDAAFHVGAARKGYKLVQSAGRFNLYRGMQQFFGNGGGPCWIVSVGSYGDGQDEQKNKAVIDKGALEAGIAALESEQEPTLVVVPDAVLLPDEASCIGVQQAMLKHCGQTMKNRVAILDIYGGHKALEDRPVDNFRDHLGLDFLDFAAAYYPFLHTSIVQSREVGYENVSNAGDLLELLREDLGLKQEPGPGQPKEKKIWDTLGEVGRTQEQWKQAYKQTLASATSGTAPASVVDDTQASAWIADRKHELHKTLEVLSPGFNRLLGEMKLQLNLLPPSPAMAGIYCMVDNMRGVWKAPANVSLADVVRPAVVLSHDDQELLNDAPSGKSINAIRSFVGEGVLVWGARTLDGNSLDWRYINVRRTMIMLEESCRLAAKALVFEPNDANTWTTIKSMIDNFLTGIWKRGGLAGAVPEDAFGVQLGFGQTMTQQDLLDGILRVTVLVAMTRPAEFMQFTFEQKMQQP